jgi:hypothetical protein
MGRAWQLTRCPAQGTPKPRVRDFFDAGRPKEQPTSFDRLYLERWFAVSGDSRNCGDVVMPAIAESALRRGVALYWHLGDFRVGNGIDEDLQYQYGNKLTPDEYRRIAWGDSFQTRLRLSAHSLSI